MAMADARRAQPPEADGEGHMSLLTSRITCVLLLSTLGLALYGCGDAGEDGAAQLAKQQELRAAKEEAARDARQGARIAELERRLKAAGRSGSGAGGDASARTDEPEEIDASLIGAWAGEAVIRYDSGKSDPFTQTIRIESLAPGAVAGYSEAAQGSTTCHGPLTYLGLSEGWYRFSAEERNTAECIDASEVELMPDGTDGLEYRETTEVSVSTGRLQRDG